MTVARAGERLVTSGLPLGNAALEAYRDLTGARAGTSDHGRLPIYPRHDQ